MAQINSKRIAKILCYENLMPKCYHIFRVIHCAPLLYLNLSTVFLHKELAKTVQIRFTLTYLITCNVKMAFGI
jgi:hypothetical protein